MTLAEFKKEFQTHYDMSSYGAPELNNYEISMFLTQAVRETVEEIYRNFENGEYMKRGLAPLIREESLDLKPAVDYYQGVEVTDALLPVDVYFILQENAKMNNQCGDLQIISEDLDNLNKTIKNPFRKPSSKKILRTQISKEALRLYSSDEITKYKIKYIKKYSPIILSDFSTDPDLLGTETIDGRNKQTNTELPDFLHDKIVRRGVVLAIKSFRENNLQTQTKV